MERTDSILGGSCHSGREVIRYPTESKDQFGTQKRRLVEEFAGLTLLSSSRSSHNQRQKSPENKKSGARLIEVIESIDFDAAKSQCLSQDNSSPDKASLLNSQKKVVKPGSPTCEDDTVYN